MLEMETAVRTDCLEASACATPVSANSGGMSKHRNNAEKTNYRVGRTEDENVFTRKYLSLSLWNINESMAPSIFLSSESLRKTYCTAL